MEAAHQLGPAVGLVAACIAVGVSRATLYRRGRAPAPARPRATPARALSAAERQDVLSVLHEARFVDKAPAEIYAELLDEGTYLCSLRTMYRILESKGEVRERRDQLRHPPRAVPRLVAQAPNQVWSWDITKLLGPFKGSIFHLYVMLDIFSRYVVGWMVAENESGPLAGRLIASCCRAQQVTAGQLTIHADRGAAMMSKTVEQLTADLDIAKSHSRPRVSNDNPFSESQFKTLKYRPNFPDRFGSAQHARAWARDFFHWYNDEHHHSRLGLLTPADIHLGRAPHVLAHRQRVLEHAYSAHPERFVHGQPLPTRPPLEVWINPPHADVAITPIEVCQPNSKSA
jgi:putative transposase